MEQKKFISVSGRGKFPVGARANPRLAGAWGMAIFCKYIQYSGCSLTESKTKLETVSIAEPLQNRQHARLMLSTLERKGKREG